MSSLMPTAIGSMECVDNPLNRGGNSRIGKSPVNAQRSYNATLVSNCTKYIPFEMRRMVPAGKTVI